MAGGNVILAFIDKHDLEKDPRTIVLKKEFVPVKIFDCDNKSVKKLFIAVIRNEIVS